MFDVNGLLESSRKDLSGEQRKYAHEHAASKDLLDVVNSVKPTALIGVSTVGKTVTKPIAEEAYQWSNGKAIYAAGVQFDPVHLDGKTYLPGQANNFYIFRQSDWLLRRRKLSAFPMSFLLRQPKRDEWLRRSSI